MQILSGDYILNISGMGSFKQLYVFVGEYTKGEQDVHDFLNHTYLFYVKWIYKLKCSVVLNSKERYYFESPLNDMCCMHLVHCTAISSLLNLESFQPARSVAYVIIGLVFLKLFEDFLGLKLNIFED